MSELWYLIVLIGIGTMGAGVFVLLLGAAAALGMILEDDE
jgi:hypothetical protein